MNIQEYKDKVEWYFKEEYSQVPIEEIAKGSESLSDELDNLIESGYEKNIHFPKTARKIRDALKKYYNDIS